jgi:hypothetical protein
MHDSLLKTSNFLGKMVDLVLSHIFEKISGKGAGKQRYSPKNLKSS